MRFSSEWSEHTNDVWHKQKDIVSASAWPCVDVVHVLKKGGKDRESARETCGVLQAKRISNRDKHSRDLNWFKWGNPSARPQETLFHRTGLKEIHFCSI